MFNNKKIFILGMARSGYQAARILSKYNNEIVINDGNENQDKEHIKELENLGVKVVLGSHPDNLLDETFDYLIKNPGIHFDHKYLQFCEKHNIKVINEIEMAYHLLPKGVKLIAITGTNGKTTTTMLTYEIFKKAFPGKAHLAGNIGYPLCEVIENIKENDYLIMEIGVPQLHDFYDFNPDVGVLTNIYEAHLDMFKTREYYNETKLRLFQNHNKNHIAIINKGNADAYRITKNIKSNIKYFSSKDKESDCYIEKNIIYYNNNKIYDVSNAKIKGMHNYENIMCAIMCAKSFNIDNETIKNVINNFNAVEHRIEFVRTLNGKDFYNDSKATNITSTQIALNAFTNPTILLLGGLERMQSFLELKEYLKNTKLVICFGQCKDRIKEEMNKLKITCEVVNNLEEATLLANEKANEGDIILLSPGSASWDQYKCFEDRGTEFKEIVNKLKK